MATQQDGAAPARWEARGGALDAETRQQVAELNLRALGVLLDALAAAPIDAVATLARTSSGGASGHGRLASPAGPVSRLRHPAATAAAAPGGPGGEHAVAQSTGTLPRSLVANAAAWRSLGESGQQSLAAAPFLLLDLQVSRLLSRRESVPGRVSESRVESPLVTAPATTGWHDLGRVVFKYAWHLSRVAPVLAGFVFGLRQAEVEALRKLGLSRVDALAPAAASCLHLRWEDDVAFWADWLAGASGGDATALWSCQLRGLQRIAGDCRCEPAA